MLNMTFGNKHQEGIVDLMEPEFDLYTHIDIDCKLDNRYKIHLPIPMDLLLQP